MTEKSILKQTFETIFANVNELIGTENENPVTLEIFHGLLEVAKHLKGPEHAMEFNVHFEQIETRLEELSTSKQWKDFKTSIQKNVRQAEYNQGEHDPNSSMPGVLAFFYEGEYQSWYKQTLHLKNRFSNGRASKRAQKVQLINEDESFLEKQLRKGNPDAFAIVEQ